MKKSAKIQHTTCILSLLLSPLLASSQQQLEIKGVRVNHLADCQYISSLETRTGTLAKSCENKVPGFFTQITFLDGTSSMYIKQDQNSIITDILVSKFSFSQAYDAFVIKYGNGKKKESIVQNKMGATFDQVEVVWEDENSYLTLSKHGSRLDEPLLYLTSKKAMKDHADRRKEAAGNI